MIKAIFFDFDMTLVNTGTIGHIVYDAFSRHANLKPTERAFDRYMGGRVSDALDMFSKNGADRKELFKLFMRIHDEKMNQIKVYGKEILKYLRKKKIKVVILSNTSRKVLKKVCKQFNLHYSLLIGDEDMPKGTEKHQAISKTIRKLGLTKDGVLYVGDHIHDIQEGKKAGVKVISVTTGVYSGKQLEKYKPYMIISNLNQLKNII